MSIRGLIDEWSAAAAFDFTEGNDVSGIAYTDCAKKLEAALPTWTKITEGKPDPERWIIYRCRLADGWTELIQTKWHKDSFARMDNVYWRPLCDLDYPPEEQP